MKVVKKLKKKKKKKVVSDTKNPLQLERVYRRRTTNYRFVMHQNVFWWERWERWNMKGPDRAQTKGDKSMVRMFVKKTPKLSLILMRRNENISITWWRRNPVDDFDSLRQKTSMTDSWENNDGEKIARYKEYGKRDAHLTGDCLWFCWAGLQTIFYAFFCVWFDCLVPSWTSSTHCVSTLLWQTVGFTYGERSTSWLFPMCTRPEGFEGGAGREWFSLDNDWFSIGFLSVFCFVL